MRNYDLFGHKSSNEWLPEDYRPMKPEHFDVERIFLAKGSLSPEPRRLFVSGICGLFPDAEIIDVTGTPHNKIDLGEDNHKQRHLKGKKTLVFGEHASAVRFSDEEGNTCPNYWHFSPYGFCPYGCRYCYLSGTLGVWSSPTVKIYLNMGDILKEIDRQASAVGKPVAFYVGKLQDGLALDSLTAYSTVFVPFFAKHAFARQVILTKSDGVDRLLELDHGGHTILSWSIIPHDLSARFEENVPSVESRLMAMKKCSDEGYPVRAVIMPVIPVEDREEIYSRFVKRLLQTVTIQRLTIGGICMYRNARRLMEMKLGRNNSVSEAMDEDFQIEDGRFRYPVETRLRLYGSIIETARRLRPDLEIALCLEERSVWKTLGIENNLGRCNCVL